ncbi:Sprouty-related, EVH1 domain-containing protein 2 [Portunus trituberculatus]|uniref:Sprouty-related, EVH1 domain-containing protein 2 n=1 Tax=Portunus trituberculatus TaxID=210409 RepID=A0A5B7CGM2_PORTR|nr:Sprouty-related, EVH1 domain-containing protein 2 [Portunus trituberculatus]
MRAVPSPVPTKPPMRFSVGNYLVRVRAQVMMRDDSTGLWVPMGGGGLSNVSVRKRVIQPDLDDSKHEYLIYGKRISDQTVVLSCTIKKDFEYYKVMPTFHHWKTGDMKFGLTFQTAADARAFDNGVCMAFDDLVEEPFQCEPKHANAYT